MAMKTAHGKCGRSWRTGQYPQPNLLTYLLPVKERLAKRIRQSRVHCLHAIILQPKGRTSSNSSKRRQLLSFLISNERQATTHSVQPSNKKKIRQNLVISLPNAQFKNLHTISHQLSPLATPFLPSPAATKQSEGGVAHTNKPESKSYSSN